MCGISGIASKSLDRDSLPRVIEQMARSIRHRGPDGTDSRCFYAPAVSRSVALGHNRLAIIDVSDAGREPMANEDETIWLVFNGEIYNFQDIRPRLESRGHRFHSHTDAEVILHLYEEMGPQCVKQLDGIFAFAILDLKRDLLFLARDCTGVKPLFYAASPGQFLFGSEIKAILASSLVTPEANWQAVWDFFTFSYVPGPQTAFCGIYQVPPAHHLTIRLADLSLNLGRYWDVAPKPEFETASYKQLKSCIRDTLSASVRRQLVSDVPLGVFLSGGIDSTIVAGIAKSANADIRTYTLALHGDDYKFFNESEKARCVSRHLGTEHHELPLEPPDVLDMLDLVEFFDQPFANPTSYLMYHLSRKAREHITVALCGAGGDELFAGYPRSKAVRFARHLGRVPRPILKTARASLGLLHDSHRTPHLRRARKFLAGLDSDFIDQYSRWTYFLNEGEKSELLRPHMQASTAPIRARPSAQVLQTALSESTVHDVDNRILQMDLKTFLVDNVLEYTDRMSMAVALEVRVPILSPEFIELGLNTPFAYKVRNGAAKAILADAFVDFFPREARNAPKRGFNAPLALWINQLLDPYFDASAQTRHPLRKRFGDDVGASWHDGILDFRFIENLRDDHRRGRRDASHELFACVLFDIWWRKYIRRTLPIVHWRATKEWPCASST